MAGCTAPPPPSAPPAGRSPPLLDDEAFLACMTRSVVRVEVMDGGGDVLAMGTGFFVERGKVATARHVLEGSVAARICFAAGRSFPVAGVLWESAELDLALLAVDTPGVDPVPLPLQATPPGAGARLVTVGPPIFGDPLCIASYGHVLPPPPGGDVLDEGIRFRMPLAPGWSGSPVISADGEVVGVAAEALDAFYALAVPASHLVEALAAAGDLPPRALSEVAAREVEYGRPEEGDEEEEEPPARLQAIYADRARGDLDGAVALLREFLAKAPADAEAWRCFAALLSEQGKEMESIAALRKVCELQPSSAEAFYDLGSACLDASMAAEAVAALRECVRLDGEDKDAHYGLGYALTGIGEFEAAVAEFRAVLRLDPGYSAARMGIDYAQALAKRPR
jgi:Flp pilus assembly protein TadD